MFVHNKKIELCMPITTSCAFIPPHNWISKEWLNHRYIQENTNYQLISVFADTITWWYYIVLDWSCTAVFPK